MMLFGDPTGSKAVLPWSVGAYSDAQRAARSTAGLRVGQECCKGLERRRGWGVSGFRVFHTGAVLM